MRTMLMLAVILAGCGPQMGPTESLGTETQGVEEPLVAPPARLWAELAVQPKLTGFPCEVRQVLQANCASCHANVSPYIHGFISRDDFARVQADGTTFGQRAVQRMAETQLPMPPLGVTPQPSADDQALIASWVAAGMPGGACGDLTPP